jgi:hypothetical protein
MKKIEFAKLVGNILKGILLLLFFISIVVRLFFFDQVKFLIENSTGDSKVHFVTGWESYNIWLCREYEIEKTIEYSDGTLESVVKNTKECKLNKHNEGIARRYGRFLIDTSSIPLDGRIEVVENSVFMVHIYREATDRYDIENPSGVFVLPEDAFAIEFFFNGENLLTLRQVTVIE